MHGETLKNFSKILAFVIHHHMSHYFKNKLNPIQFGVSKTKSATTNLVSILISFLL